MSASSRDEVQKNRKKYDIIMYFFLVNIIAWIAEVASFDYFTSTYVETMHMRLHFRLLNYKTFFQQFRVYKISF